MTKHLQRVKCYIQIQIILNILGFPLCLLIGFILYCMGGVFVSLNDARKTWKSTHYLEVRNSFCLIR